MGSKKPPPQVPSATVTFDRVRTWTLWIVLGVFAATMNLTKIAGDDDVFWHLATGRYIVEHKTVPGTDVFNFPIPNQQWIPFEWGWDVVTYFLYSISDSFIPAYILVMALWLAICAFLISTMKRLQIPTPVIALTLLFTLLTSHDRMTIRPHAVTLLGLASVMYLYVKFRYDERKRLSTLFWLPLIFILWANMHPGVISGMFLLLLIFASEFISVFFGLSSLSEPGPDRKTLLQISGVFVVSILATLLNPHGINTFLYTYSHTQMKLLSVIIEWLPPFGGAPPTVTLTLYEITLGLGALSFLLLIKKRQLLPAIVILGFGLTSLRAVRFIADYSVMSCVGIALGLHVIARQINAVRRFLQSTLAVVLAIVLSLWLGSTVMNGSMYTWLGLYRHFGTGIDEEFFPSSLSKFLESNNIRGHPFNELEIGGYLLWERPGEPNFIDSRNISDSLGKEYYRILESRQGFEDRLTAYDIDYMVIYLLELTEDPASVRRTPIPYLTYRHDVWKLVYWDDVSFVYVKDVPKFHEVVKKYEYTALNPFLLSYNPAMIDSLRKAEPERFEQQLRRKVREEPNGFITNLFVSYSQRPLRK